MLCVERLCARHHRDGPLMLDAVGLELGPAECLAVAASSGQGKTTLARCLAGHHVAESGTIQLARQPLAPNLRDCTRAERQSVQLIPRMPAVRSTRAAASAPPSPAPCAPWPDSTLPPPAPGSTRYSN